MPDAVRVILAGGGDARDSRPLDALFAAWTGPRGRMLYLPVAMKGSRHSYESCLAWIRSVFTPLGVLNIEMWTDLGEHDVDELAAFASVYLGGGNTFGLLAQLKDSGFDAGLAQFARQGGAIYGGSAGAIVLGRDIMPCAHLDRNEVGLIETEGLDLVAGHDVWCHYQADDDAGIGEYIQKRGFPVLAISETAGIALQAGQFASAGYKPAYRFDENGKCELLRLSSSAWRISDGPGGLTSVTQ
jgi:dipeptidase E